MSKTIKAGNQQNMLQQQETHKYGGGNAMIVCYVNLDCKSLIEISCGSERRWAIMCMLA